MLLELLTTHHLEIVARTRFRGADHRAPSASNSQLMHGIPVFLQQLAEVLASASPNLDALGRSAALHGNELLEAGFSVAQVVHGYRDVCQVVSELAREKHVRLDPEELRTFNVCLDEAVAQALTEYGQKRELSISTKSTQHIGEFAHEIRNLLNTAELAFDTSRDCHMSGSSRSSAILGRSLRRMHELVHRSLTGVRLDAHLFHPQPIRISELVEELELCTTLDARARHLRLLVSDVPRHLYVFGDRSLLSSAITNLLQNALKFTHPHSTVTLRVHSTELKVFVDVEDECGGLSLSKVEELFRPFEQLGADTSGVGLGLTISRKAIEANGGALSVRNLPDDGCIFTAELPRLRSDMA